jgi:hypothetical protein
MNAVKSRGASVDSAPRHVGGYPQRFDLSDRTNQQGVKPGTTGFSPWGSMELSRLFCVKKTRPPLTSFPFWFMLVSIINSLPLHNC